MHPRDAGWGPRALWRKLVYVTWLELRHRSCILAEAGLVPKHIGKWMRLVSQDYTGDITIIPVPGHLNDFLQVMSNPTINRIEECIVEGERATWPVLALIKSRCSVELALAECYHQIRRKCNEKILVGNLICGDEMESVGISSPPTLH